ncbi:hypothetical protein GCK72_019807 [Caenorhabditis remanei]|uniref:SPK domain-containing protein n=1 Tax=Caenorhabditis remanei TaxID=31234 RepID=A0A6A5GF94_CAERE|nr:hypothetical protein GCK72_019807 [Caenorhabditis remanei]KAF1753251.1 hypothetical protein GCK72_019807 [Caenorhabditis remanei]
MPRQLNEEEEAQIFKFFAEESENATSPFELNSFCSKFRKKYETDITHNDLKVIFCKLRLKIHEKNEYDMDLRVRMMFALRVPVNSEFLVVLRKNAEVEVNRPGRIISYKKYDGGLELAMKSKSKVSTKKSKIKNPPTMLNAQIGNLREKHRLETPIVNESITASDELDGTDGEIENIALKDSFVDPAFSRFSDGPSSSNRSKRNIHKRVRYSPIKTPDRKQKKKKKSTTEKSTSKTADFRRENVEPNSHTGRYSIDDEKVLRILNHYAPARNRSDVREAEDTRRHRICTSTSPFDRSTYLNADGSGPSSSDAPMGTGLRFSSTMTENYFSKPDDFSSGPIVLAENMQTSSTGKYSSPWNIPPLKEMVESEDERELLDTQEEFLLYKNSRREKYEQSGGEYHQIRDNKFQDSEGSSYFTTSLIQTQTQHFPKPEINSTQEEAENIQNEDEDEELIDIETISEEINSERREEEQCGGNVLFQHDGAVNSNEKSTEIEEYRNNMDCKVQREDSGIGGCHESADRKDDSPAEFPFYQSFAESKFLSTSEVSDKRIDEQETVDKDCNVLIKDSEERDHEMNLENAQKQNDSIPVDPNIPIESSERNGNQHYSGEESPDVVLISNKVNQELAEAFEETIHNDYEMETERSREGEQEHNMKITQKEVEDVSTVEANVSIRSSDQIGSKMIEFIIVTETFTENGLDSTEESTEFASNELGNEIQESSEIVKEAIGTGCNMESEGSREELNLERTQKEVESVAMGDTEPNLQETIIASQLEMDFVSNNQDLNNVLDVSINNKCAQKRTHDLTNPLIYSDVSGHSTSTQRCQSVQIPVTHNNEIQDKQKSVSPSFRFAPKRPREELPEERSSILASFRIQNPKKSNETAIHKSETRIAPKSSVSSVEKASTKPTIVIPPEKIHRSSIPNSKISIKENIYTEHSLISTAPDSYEKSKRAPIGTEENPEDVGLSSSEIDSIDSTADKKPKPEFLSPKREEDSSKPVEWFIYSKALLHQLRAIIITLDSPLLVDLRKAVEDNFNTIKDKKIPIQGIISVLQTLLYVTVNSAKPEENSNSSLSLKSFLTVLRHTLNNFEISDLGAFGEEIKQEINKIGKDDKTVSIEKIRPAFETILLLTKI